MASSVGLQPSSFDYDPEEYQRLLQKAAPGLFQAGQQATDDLKMPAGVWDEEKFRQITAHLRQPYVEQGQKSLESLTASMRARGMADSTRHGQYLIERAEQTQRQIAQNVDVPLILEQLRQQGTARRATIQQSAEIGAQQLSAYQAMRGQRFGEGATEAELTGLYGGEQTQQAQQQAFQQRLATRQMELQDEVERGQLTVAQARQKLDEEVQSGELSGMFRGAGTLRARQQTFDQVLAARQMTLEEQVQNGQLTVAEARQALDDFVQRGQLELQAGELSGMFRGSETLAAQRQVFEKTIANQQFNLEEKVRTGQLTIEQARQTLAEEIERGELALSESQQKFLQEYQRTQQDIDRRLAEAGLTGDYYDKDGNLVKKTLSGRELELRKDNDRFAQAIERAKATGTFIDPETRQPVETLQKWQMQLAESAVSGTYKGVPTLEAALQRAQLTGELTDPETGLPQATLAKIQSELAVSVATGKYKGSPTLEAEIEKARLTGRMGDKETLESLRQAADIELQRARTTGIYRGNPTLESQMQTWTQEHQDRAVFGYDVGGTMTLDQLGLPMTRRPDGTPDIDALFQASDDPDFQRKLTEALGHVATPTELNELIQTGRLATPVRHIYGTNELQMVMQTNEQQFKRMTEQGYSYVDENGDPRRVKGTDERIEDEREYQEIVRTGYDEPVMRNGRPLQDAQGNQIMRHVEGTQEASSRIRERELELQDRGLTLDDAHRQATLEQQTREYEGYFKLRTFDLEDLGLSKASFENLSGGQYFDAFFELMDRETLTRLRSYLGGADPTEQDVRALLDGHVLNIRDNEGNPISSWVEGTAGLEQRRITMQETLQRNGFTQETAERRARQTYERDIANGYWGTGRTGHPEWIRGTQEFQEQIINLQSTLSITETDALWKLQEQSRIGYNQIVETPSGPRNIRIHGTQEFQADENELQRQLQRDLQQLGFDQQTAERIAAEEYSEEVRTGHFKTVDTPSGPRTMWVGGTQDFQQSLQDQADDLVRDGWTQDAAMQRSRIAADTAAQFGGWRESIDPYGRASFVYVPGTEASETARLGMVQDFEREGWSHDDAVRASQYVMSQATDDLAFLGQNYIDQRKWYYENTEGLSAAAASDRALADWNSVKDTGFGGQMQIALAQMELDAAEKRYDAQIAADSMNALISSGATVVGNLLSRPGAVSAFADLAQMSASGEITKTTLTIEAVRSTFARRGVTLTDPQAQAIIDSGGGWIRTTVDYSNPAGTDTLLEWLPRADVDKYSGLTTGEEIGAYIASNPFLVNLTNAAPILAPVALLYAFSRHPGAFGPTKEEIAEMEATGERRGEVVSQWMDTLPVATQRVIRDGFADLNLGETGGMGVLAMFMKDERTGEYLLDGPSGDGDTFDAQREYFRRNIPGIDRLLTLQSDPVGNVAPIVMGLLDRNVFAQDPWMVSVADLREVEKAWEMLPGDARSASPRAATFEQKLDDVRAFGAAVGIRSTASLSREWSEIQGLFDKDARAWTRRDKDRIERVYRNINPPPLFIPGGTVYNANLSADAGQIVGDLEAGPQYTFTTVSEAYASGDAEFQYLTSFGRVAPGRNEHTVYAIFEFRDGKQVALIVNGRTWAPLDQTLFYAMPDVGSSVDRFLRGEDTSLEDKVHVLRALPANRLPPPVPASTYPPPEVAAATGGTAPPGERVWVQGEDGYWHSEPRVWVQGEDGYWHSEPAGTPAPGTAGAQEGPATTQPPPEVAAATGGTTTPSPRGDFALGTFQAALATGGTDRLRQVLEGAGFAHGSADYNNALALVTNNTAAARSYLESRGWTMPASPVTGTPAPGTAGAQEGPATQTPSTPDLLAPLRSGQWSEATVDPVVAAVRAGTISAADVMNLPIAEYRRLHILQRAGIAGSGGF